MGIHRARLVWAAIALAGLAGCQSGGSNNLAFWKSNPLSSKTAAATSKPQYPPKPSTQVANPADPKASTSGLAANPTTKSSTSFPGAATSFTAPANPPAATHASAAVASTASQRGLPSATAGTLDPVVSPQRGYYSSPTSPTARPTGAVSSNGVGTYSSSDLTAGRSAGAPASGFRSGAKDYTSAPMDYTSASTGSSVTTGGATVPRFGAAADRNSNPTAPSYEPLATASRSNSASHPVGSGFTSGPSSYGYGASASAPVASGAQTRPTDPFQAGSRATPFASSSGTPERSASPPSGQTSPNASGMDRNATAYANPFASRQASPAGSPGQDRAARPNYRDYPSTDPLATRPNQSDPPTAGNYAPSNGRPVSPTNDFRSSAPAGSPFSDSRPGNTGFPPPASDYRPGNTGYRPPASDYRPGDTGYRPPATSPYRGPNGSAPPADEPPPFRPGSTSDYVPKAANGGPTASTASRDLFGPRSDSGVQPTGYTAGGPDYRR